MNLVKVSNRTISNTQVRRVGCWEATAKSEGNPHYGSFTPTNRKLEGGLSAECCLSMDLLRGGLPLPSKLRIQMERLFGVDFSTVRWHEGDEATRLGAVAFTYGEHLYFPKGGFKPNNSAFLAILGHELAHVIQQRFGLTEGFTETVVEDALLENEADAAGCLVAAGQSVRLASILGRTQLQKTVPRIQAIKLSINNIHAGTLLQFIDIKLLEAISDFSNSSQHIKITPDKSDERKGNWLNFVGNLNTYPQQVLSLPDKKEPLLPCTIQLTLNDGLCPQPSRMDVKPYEKTERLYFPQTLKQFFPRRQFLDLSYPDIANAFGIIMNGYQDSAIARDMLLIAMGKKPQTNYQQHQLDFLAGVVTLMFGMEASRFPSALVTSLMILDLIMFDKTYGRRGKPFTLADAFDKKDNGQSRSFDLGYLYGGKYPYAVHKPGIGNAGNRRILGDKDSHLPSFKTQLLASMLYLNHRLIVPRREVTLFIHWLEAKIDKDQDVRDWTIVHHLTQRLEQAYKTLTVPRQQEFPGSARTDQSGYPPKMNKLPLADLIDKDVWLIWDKQQLKFGGGKYYHSTPDCKLIADSVLHPQEYSKTYKTKFQEQNTQLKERTNYELKIAQYKPNDSLFSQITPCPYCISIPHQDR